jgi:hypothetical protein
VGDSQQLPHYKMPQQGPRMLQRLLKKVPELHKLLHSKLLASRMRTK